MPNSSPKRAGRAAPGGSRVESRITKPPIPTERELLDPDDTVILVAEAIFPTRKPACLVAVTGACIGRRYPMCDEPMIIGRSPDADIRVEAPGVSRKHAIIIPGKQEVLVEDLNSTNGTQVNGQAIEGRHRLVDGEQVQVGIAVFKFLEGDSIEQTYYDEVFRLMVTDELTGTYNRRYLFDTLEREYARAARHEHELSFILFDIDHFKRLNDTWGHVAGDRVLEGLAKRVGELCEVDDVLARYGGEEFAVLLPERGKADAVVTAERIRRAVGATPFPAEGQRLPVTVSLGVASVSELDVVAMRGRGVPLSEQIHDLVRLADSRLYEAKAAGRNRTVG